MFDSTIDQPIKQQAGIAAVSRLGLALSGLSAASPHHRAIRVAVEKTDEYVSTGFRQSDKVRVSVRCRADDGHPHAVGLFRVGFGRWPQPDLNAALIIPCGGLSWTAKYARGLIPGNAGFSARDWRPENR